MPQVFWISLLFVLYTYLGYPIIIVLWSKLFPKPVLLNMEHFEWPRVTMIIIAYNEEANITRKIENCRELDYSKELLEICIVSDGSTDSTNDILREQLDIHIIIDDSNHGKPYQINRAVRETSGDIIVFADARQIFDGNALKMLIRNFSDPTIGSVSGELIFISPADHTEHSIGVYWKYEKILRKAESAIDSTLGVTGAIYAIRRDLFTPIPKDAILDDIEIPLHIFREGYRVVFEQEAKAYDTASSSMQQELRRKIRTLSGNFQLYRRNLWLLSPLENRIFIQSTSHKLIRLIVPYALLFMLISSLLYNNIYINVFCLFQLILYILFTISIFNERLRNIRFLNLLAVFFTMNAAAVVAVWIFLFNRIDVKWKNRQ